MDFQLCLKLHSDIPYDIEIVPSWVCAPHTYIHAVAGGLEEKTYVGRS
jgi:hypothetical protein